MGLKTAVVAGSEHAIRTVRANRAMNKSLGMWGHLPLFSVSGPTFYNFALRLWLSVRGAERDRE